MKTTTRMLSAATLLAIGGIAQAAGFNDWAEVVSATPRYEEVNRPREECRTVYEPVYQQRNWGGAILGGLTGGVVGSQVGKGNGRIVAAAVGAAAGSMIGDRIANREAVAGERPVQRCELVDRWERHVTGYDVTYAYHGHTYTTFMPQEPGRRMRVHVEVSPR